MNAIYVRCARCGDRLYPNDPRVVMAGKWTCQSCAYADAVAKR